MSTNVHTMKCHIQILLRYNFSVSANHIKPCRSIMFSHIIVFNFMFVFTF